MTGSFLRRRFCVCASLAVVTAGVIAGCGGTSTQNTSTGSHGSSGSTATGSAASAGGSGTQIAYSGPEASLPTSVGVPTKTSGKACTIGFLQIYGGVGTLVAQGNAVKAETQRLGCKYVELDANLNAQNEVSLFNQLVSQHVSAIVVFPVDPGALGPELKQAAAAKIPVIAMNATTAGTEKLASGYDTTINEDLDTSAYNVAKNAAARSPHGTFVVMGTSLPIPTVQYEQQRLAYWGKKFGLHFLGQVSNTEDNPTGYAAAATTLAARYPHAKVVFAYDDPYALAVAQTLRASGQTGALIYSSIGGEQDGLAAVKDGRLAGVYAIPWRQIGTQSADAAYDVLTHQHLPLPKLVFPHGVLATSSNVNSVQSVP